MVQCHIAQSVKFVVQCRQYGSALMGAELGAVFSLPALFYIDISAVRQKGEEWHR